MKCCREIILLKYSDRELKPSVSRKIRTHLEKCARCRGRLKELESENKAIRKMFLPVSEMPDLTGVIGSRIAGQDPGQLHRNRPGPLIKNRLALVAASLSLIFILTFLVLRQPSKPSINRVLLVQSSVNRQIAQPFIYQDEKPDVLYVWLEKSSQEN